MVKSDRYQHQPWYIKAYRWFRHKPIWWLTGLYWVGAWAIKGCRIEPFERQVFGNRQSLVAWYLKAADSQAEIAMKHYWKLSEVIERFKNGERFRRPKRFDWLRQLFT